MMNKEQTRAILRCMMVRQDYYNLDEYEMDEERQCLVKVDDGWEVYISERGHKIKYAKFDIESEACFEILKRLLKRDKIIKIKQLRMILSALRVKPHLYNLDWFDKLAPKEECECIDKVDARWRVYFFERGQEKFCTYFDTESEACFEMLKRLV